MLRPNFHRLPTTSRWIVILGVTATALGFTFTFNAGLNAQIASGAAISIVVLGLTWLTGWSGQISLGNSGFMACGGYFVGVWANHHAATPLVISLLFATAAGALGGLILAVPATRLRGPYLAGATLAFATVTSSLVYVFGNWTGGPTSQLFLNSLTTPSWFARMFSGIQASLNSSAQYGADLAICVAAIAFLFMSNLFHSRLGRAMTLVRDNDVSAELMGINLRRTRTIAFVIAAALGGLGGGLQTLLTGSVTPGSFPLTISSTLLTLMVLGGIGTLTGAVLGGLIFAVSSNVINWLCSTAGISSTSNLGTNMQGIVFSVLLMTTMLIAPQGISGNIVRGYRHLMQRFTSKIDNSPA